MKRRQQFTVYSLQKLRGRWLRFTVNGQLSTVNSQKGFTLLVAALVSSIVIALGAAIFSIAQKEVTLSSIGRDSQYAFYAADTASECALYWDSRFQRFPTSTATAVSLECDDQPATTESSKVGNTVTSSFQFEPNGYCADVTVEKELIVADNTVRTVIRADGFSTNCDAVESSPRALQRSVELHY